MRNKVVRRQKVSLQDTVNVVCTFLELAPVIVKEDDTIDSLTGIINANITNSSTFARDMIFYSTEYTPLKLHNILHAVTIKHDYGTSKRIEDEDVLRSLYPIGVKKLHTILDSLTRDYCTFNCHHDDLNGDFRCCGGHDTYKSRLEDLDILMLQEQEGIRSSRMQKHLSKVFGCKYLNTDSGCTLTISKSPLCIGFICGSIEKYLREIAPKTAEDFIMSMNDVSDIKYTRITHEKILALDQAALLGKLVIDESKMIYSGA